MAALDFHRAPHTTGSVGGFFANTLANFRSWNDARATRKALSQLSNHELDDIGLVRGDIDDMRYQNLIR
ncbi:DUF1127 domain-containing protein [Pseudaestuariivita sp.]|uniref:DUF1127 domain-containing protein n=1 Tax=Pseudaestuariivita sp. TaxID=2211669 RepID=UPI004058CBD1